MTAPDYNAPGWVLIAGEWRWTGAGPVPPPPFVPTGCDCDAYDGDHAGTCAIYVQPPPYEPGADAPKQPSAMSHNELHQNLMEVWHSGTGLMGHRYRRCPQSGAGNCCCGRDDADAALHNDGVRQP